MAKIHKRLLYLLFASALLFNCAGEDGEPGPAGEQGVQGEKGDKGDKGDTGDDALGYIAKVGTLEGKISGTRRDGTAFEFPFSYEHTYSSGNGFRDDQGRTAITIQRLTSGQFQDYFQLELQKVNGTLVPLEPTYSAAFRFRKELNATTLFSLEAAASFANFSGEFRPISKAANSRYAFYANGTYFYQTNFDGQEVYSVSGSNRHHYYSVSTGLHVATYSYADGTYASGELFDKYSEVKFIYDSNTGQHKFIDSATGADLHEEIPAVPADKLTITNYSHDATTGVLSFDFKLEISKYDVAGRTNSSNNDLVMEGKYNSGTKVYGTTVGRTKN
ncbi:MAG TPA: collagen-like protein [Chryseosolibacter sp.]